MTVFAFVEVVFRVLEKKLQLDHKKSRDELVLAFFGLIKLID
jgi:hypothetical protein